MENKKTNQISYLLGQIVGEFVSGVLALALIALIVFFCWNYALVDATPLSKINYWQSALLILGFRAITFKKQNKK